MKKVEWECWVVVKNTYTGDLESTQCYIAVTDDDKNSLDVLSSLHNRILSEPDEYSDNHLIDFKLGS